MAFANATALSSENRHAYSDLLLCHAMPVKFNKDHSGEYAVMIRFLLISCKIYVSMVIFRSIRLEWFSILLVS